MPSTTPLSMCLVVLSVALLALEVSAVRTLRAAAPASVSAFEEDTERGFGRQLKACALGCSNLLGSAAKYGALGAETVTNTGATRVNGKVGVFAGTSITGFDTPTGGRASGGVHRADLSAQFAQSDAKIAYGRLENMTCTTPLTGQNLGERTLTPGVYCYTSSGFIRSGTLTLDGKFNPTSIFVFQFVSTFITAVGSHVKLINGAQACNVFYQVGSSATLGTSSTLFGSIVAKTTIVLSKNVTVHGSMLANVAAVNLDTDNITAPGECSDAPDSPMAPPLSPLPSLYLPSPPPPPPPAEITVGPLPSGGR